MAMFRDDWRPMPEARGKVADHCVSRPSCHIHVSQFICFISLHRGVTRDTGEEFQVTVVDWDGSIIDPFNEFINHIFRTYPFLQTWCHYAHLQLILVM